MQIKAFICLLGILLLVILLFGKLILLLIHREDGDEEIPLPTPTPHIPVIELLTNVWIMEADEEGLLIFRDGQSERCPWAAQSAGTRPDGEAAHASSRPDFNVREQVADIELTDGAVTSVEVKSDKINGKILSADGGIR